MMPAVLAVAFSPDDAFILTGSEDATARLWEIRSGVERHRWGHREQINDVTFSPDGKLAVTASDDKKARIWEVDSGREISGSPLIHSHELSKVRFSPEGRWLATMADNNVRVWYFEDQRQFPAVMGARRVQSGVLSPDGKWVVTGTADGQVAMWDSETGQPRWPMSGRRHDGAVLHLAIDRTGSLLASAGEDGRVCIWLAATGALVGSPIVHKDQVNWTEFSPNSESIATASNSNRVYHWKVKTGEKIAEFVQSSDCFTVTFDSTGKRLLSAGDDSTARLISANSGREIGGFRHEGDVVRALFSPNGGYVAIGFRRFYWTHPGCQDSRRGGAAPRTQQ